MDKSKAALSWTELRVGVVVLASLFILAFAILSIGGGGGRALKPPSLAQALIYDVDRLQSRTPVREGGGEVGPVPRGVFPGEGLGRLVNDQDMSRGLSDSVKAVERIATRSESGQGALGAPAKDHDFGRDLRALASRLNEVARRLRRGEGTMGKLVQDAALFRKLD